MLGQRLADVLQALVVAVEPAHVVQYGLARMPLGLVEEEAEEDTPEDEETETETEDEEEVEDEDVQDTSDESS